MTFSYRICIAWYSLLVIITSFIPDHNPCHLATYHLLYYVLTLWICIFRFRGLERSGAFHRGLGLPRRAGWPALDLSCPTLLLVHGSPSLRERFCIFDCISFFWTWVMIKDTCKVILLIITCATLYLYFVSWHMIIPRCVCCTLILVVLMLSVYTWGHHLTYVYALQ